MDDRFQSIRLCFIMLSRHLSLINISATMTNLIVILTDFGSKDHYVGVMKGVIAGICPQAAVIDLNHEIPPGDIRRAALTLWQAAPFFPDGTVFLAVVDPGVGTRRRPIVIKTGIPGRKPFHFVGPDNGVFSYIIGPEYQAWQLTNPKLALNNPGRTFHGRDIFAPAAAHLCRGVAGPAFGEVIRDPLKLPEPKLVTSSKGMIEGEILFTDHFGNLVTSIGKLSDLPDGELEFQPFWGEASPFRLNRPDAIILLNQKHQLPLVDTFEEAGRTQAAGLIGSSGLLEIVAYQDSAADIFSLKPGAEVVLLGRQPTT
jgi:S-adenosyl-L-methionine hydrolase (adenosine-forming)